MDRDIATEILHDYYRTITPGGSHQRSLEALDELLSRHSEEQLRNAMRVYRSKATDPKYRMSATSFFADGRWEAYYYVPNETTNKIPQAVLEVKALLENKGGDN